MTTGAIGRFDIQMTQRTLYGARSLALVVVVLAASISLGGCRESAPDDLIAQTPTTDALVFVKADQEETLNRTNGSSNLYKLSPISPSGEVTPLTNYTGASISDTNRTAWARSCVTNIQVVAIASG